MLGDTLRRYLAEKAPVEARNKVAYGDAGYSPDVWRGLAELGVIGALFDEEAGGFGGGIRHPSGESGWFSSPSGPPFTPISRSIRS